MARRKIREQKSKTQGTKHVLTSLNQAAHGNAHSSTSPTNAAGSVYTTVIKWGVDN